MRGKNNNFWMDDPEWVALREKQAGKPKVKLTRAQRKQLREAQFQAELKSRPEPKSPLQNAPVAEKVTDNNTAKNVNVSLNLTLPRVDISKLSSKLPKKLDRFAPKALKAQLRKRSKKQLWIGSASLVIITVAVLGLLLGNPSGQRQKGESKGVLAEQSIKIAFKPLLPNGKSEETTASKTALDGQGRPIYTFTDKIGNTDLTITEQPLPESLKGETDSKMEKMAKDLYLTDVINASNPKAYLGTSVKGPQTVIFTKNDLLVFIQSQSKIDKDQWSDYVTRLVQ